MPGKWLRYLGPALSLVVAVAAIWALHHILAEVHLADVAARLRETPLLSVVLALAFTAGSYLVLTFYDVLALKYIERPLPYGTAALASFTSYTFSHNIGLSLITAGSIRYRVYSAAGLSATEIVTLTGFCAVTYSAGVIALLGLALWLEPDAIAGIVGLTATQIRAIGVAAAVPIAAYVAWSALSNRPLRLKNWMFKSPSLHMAVGQIAIGTIDVCFSAAALYVVLPPGVDISFAGFVGIYVVAVTIGILSHSPGGIGVFETVMLLAIPGGGYAEVLGALVIYRCVYYLIPLAAAAGLLARHEYVLRRHALAPHIQKLRELTHAVAPQIVGIAVLAGGAILLFSGATPALEQRETLLRDILPLPFVETSHFLGSVVGVLLLILSRGLFRRLDAAYHLTLALLGAGIVFSMLKGFDYEEALILAFVSILLLMSRDAFYRKTSMLAQPFSPAWVVTIVLVVVASIWLGAFSFKHVEYSNALWWEFAYRGDAPRFLRASVAVAALAIAFLAFLLLRPATPRGLDLSLDANAARAIVARSKHADANLALTGDKRFLVSADKDAFIMFQVKGRSWVAMGDPVGNEGAWEALLWQYRDLCDRHNGWPVFYEISAAHLPLFLDLGLSLLKLGEEARVDLRAFSLDGSDRRDLRYADRRAAKDGASFAVVPAADVPGILGELKAVSDEWLADKATHEKGFSVGSFSDDYITNFDCAVVRQHGRIVAFANLWAAPEGGELSVDLMRHRKETPYGIMDYLFVQTMLWGKSAGYEWFNLGPAPLSGLQSHPLGPVWNRVGAFVFRHGEHFYNFEGLRAYKEKFAPVWQPIYLATPGGLVLPRILLDISALVSGGTKEIFRK